MSHEYKRCCFRCKENKGSGKYAYVQYADRFDKVIEEVCIKCYNEICQIQNPTITGRGIYENYER